MEIIYIDESGDPGHHKDASPHFILSGLIVSQKDWIASLEKLKKLRKSLKSEFGLNMRTELHASELIRITKIKEYKKISKTQRMKLLKNYISEIPIIFNNSKIINICIDKSEHTDKDIFELAWSRLIQRFDTYLKKQASDYGIMVVDDTQSKKLKTLLRKMRTYNPTPSHYSGTAQNIPVDNILEDPFSRNSDDSYFIQTADFIAHTLYRKEFPKGSLRKWNVQYFFNELEPILLKKATAYDYFGIVRK